MKLSMEFLQISPAEYMTFTQIEEQRALIGFPI